MLEAAARGMALARVAVGGIASHGIAARAADRGGVTPGEPVRSGSFRKLRGDAPEEVGLATDTQSGDDLLETHESGAAHSDEACMIDPGVAMPPDGVAVGPIGAVSHGATDWVAAGHAPAGQSPTREVPRVNDGRSAFMLAIIAACGMASAADVVTIDVGGVGRYSSIAIGADGMPSIAHRNGGNGGVEFARCEDLGCSRAVRDTIEDASDVARGEYLSLAFSANGRPVIAFYDTASADLAIARCDNVDCSGEELLRTLDGSVDDTGREASLMFDADGRALVAYVNSTAHSLQLAHCDAPSCANVTITEVDAIFGNSRGTGAHMVRGADGFPVIAYLDTTADSVRLAKCLDQDCASALLAIVEPQVPTTVGGSPAVAIAADGNPVLAFFDEDDLALKVAHCNDPACLGPKTVSLVDDEIDGDAGRYPAIAIRPDGTPVVSYQRWAIGGAGGAALRVAECSTSDCSGDVRIVVIDGRAGEITGVDTAIAIGSDGGVVVSYHDVTGQSLKFAKCSPQGCDGPGDRLFGDGFD